MKPKTPSEEANAVTIYYNFDEGVPAMMEPGKFPVILVKGKKVVVYKLQGFFDNAQRITLKEFQDLMKRRQ
jgi:hypothetical protein